MDKEKLKTLLISKNTMIKQAMQRLNETGERILFVVDGHNRLLGTVADGDIRRGLINGSKFIDVVKNIMRRQYISFYYKDPDKKAKARAIMIGEKIEQIPLLNKKGVIIDIILWTDIFAPKRTEKRKKFFTNPVVIMAGGRGTRLAPFTRILPKPLIPIEEKPVIEIIMEKFHNKGFNNFIYTLNYRKEYIKAFIRENSFPYNIEWVEEDEFMGTAGSLSLLKNKINETFFVSNCDIILNADFADILNWHREEKNLITLLGCHREVKIPYGVLELEDGKLKNFKEKPNYDVIINTGVYVLEPEVISLIPKNKSIDMNTLIEFASSKGRVSVYPISEGWFDIGQWDDYAKNLKELNLS